jgi:2-C-methyl-D-erythritol 4-phosphate cytidylyltransferase
MSAETQPIIAIVPAAGVGSRMQADRPKQYLNIDGKTILQHTVDKLLSHPQIESVVIAISDGDPYFPDIDFSDPERVHRVSGGKERADSVLSALDYLKQHFTDSWSLVHDAARPCVSLDDISRLIEQAQQHEVGGILAAPVRDTMKRSNADGSIAHTVERSALWHALTPQLFPTSQLHHALVHAQQSGDVVTDEASALERLGYAPLLVAGRADNIKVTQPEDLALAKFYLSHSEGEK